MHAARSTVPASARPRPRSAAALLVVLLLAWQARVAAADGAEDCTALQGDESVLPGELLADADGGWRSTPLPASAALDRALAKLDYGDELPVARALDLDADGQTDYALTSPAGRLCGNGGCPYVLLAGRPLREIGEAFGHLAVLDERINGHRVVQSWTRRRFDATDVDTLVFDGERYRLVSHLTVDPCGLEQWRRRLRKVRE